MKVLVGAAAAVIGLVLVVTLGIVGVVIADDDASATETTDGGGGLQGVPAEFRKWILKADEACKEPAMVPALLAAQLYQESKFKTSREEATSHAGAQGPAQFMPGTWATWGRDADGNGDNSPWDIGDAVMAQGRMMCSLLKQAKKTPATPATSGRSRWPGTTRAGAASSSTGVSRRSRSRAARPTTTSRSSCRPCPASKAPAC
ncbi:hypothetical protein GCM10020295_83930 [Streptomyces cinereospinus]